MRVTIAGIDTEIGKTIASAVLTEALQADYWKPIQAGNLAQSDTISVKKLVSNPHSCFFPESYAFRHAMSPHKAAELEGDCIDLSQIHVPASENIVVETAGGVMSPLNKNQGNIDLIKHIGFEVILVVKNYLGSINHTLLSLEVLKQNHIPVKGIIINGDANEASEDIYQLQGGVNIIARIPWMGKLVDRVSVLEAAKILHLK